MDMRGIAKIAGVSSATVSRVISGSNSVRPETAERVRQIIKELNFFPNSSATTLKQGKSGTYGLVIPDITNPFFPELIRSFERILVENNREMFMATTEFHPSQMQQTIRRMLVRKVDGVALLASEIETEPIESLMHNRVPLVTIDRRQPAAGVSDILVDCTGGMAAAIKHLVELRHHRIGYIGGSDGRTISDHRLRSFITAMKRHGLAVNLDHLRVGDYRVPGGEKAMQELLAMKRRPTAILTANDLTAIGALRAIHRYGFSVPEDFSLIGMDDIEFCNFVTPPLTTLRLARRELAGLLFTALESAKANPRAMGLQYSIHPKLLVRESTGRAKQSRTKT
jgi:LacI family transcriptional regulator